MSHSIKVHHRPDYKLQDYLALISLPLFCKLHVHGLVFFELLTEFSRWSTVFPATFHRSLRPFEEFNPASAFIWLFGQYNCGLADWPNSHKHFPSLTHPRSLWQTEKCQYLTRLEVPCHSSIQLTKISQRMNLLPLSRKFHFPMTRGQLWYATPSESGW